MSANQELKNTLERINMKRALYSSIALSVATPIYLLVVHFSNLFGVATLAAKIFLIFAEIFQLVFLGIGIFLNKYNETDRFALFYRTYFMGTMAFSIALSSICVHNVGGVMGYGLAAAYFTLVPVLNPRERRYMTYPLILAFVLTASMCSGSVRMSVAAAVISGVMLVASNVVHDHNISYHKLELKLKAKTLTSELDPLTQLYNRRGLEKKAATLWPYCARTGTTVGMIELDIDFFKKYNDKFGHPAGDKCIKMIAKAIRRSAQRGSDITARTGGEEFIVFCQNMTDQELVMLAMKIRNNVADMKIPHAYIGISPFVTVSMGIATCIPDKDTSFDGLYEAADKALYAAKQNGRNCIVFEDRIYGRMKRAVATTIAQ